VRVNQLLERREITLEEATRIVSQNDDPLLSHAAIHALSASVSENHISLAQTEHGLAILLAAKRNEELRSYVAKRALNRFLASEDPDVRFIAVKWIADDQLVDYRPALQKMLDAKDLDYRLFRALAAALDRLDGKKPIDYPPANLLLEKIRDDDAPIAIRRLCLRLISADPSQLKADDWQKLIEHPDHTLRLEAVRTLAAVDQLQPNPSLPQIAVNSQQPTEVRAAAVAGLSLNLETNRGQLLAMATYGSVELRAEALRSVVGVDLSKQEEQALVAAAATDPANVEAVQRLLKKSPGERPAAEDIAAWKELLAGDANAEAGERIFFGSKVGTCSRCHQIDGRGTMVGPDLSAISRRVKAEGERGVDWLLETTLQPSKHMAPQYTPWQIVTKDGKQLVGLPRRKGGNAEAYLGLDGKEFIVKKPDIELHREMPKSIMPDGLLQNLTKQELRDLFAFLMSGSQ
jgi:putative heme-binding domain-containing protein